MKAKNEPIGQVECPQKGCTETCKVFRFRPRTEGRKSVFSGKAYCDCPVHGRIGADGNPTITAYIEANATWEASAAPAAGSQKNPAPASKATPARQSSSRPDPGTTPKPAQESKPWWQKLHESLD